jgi:hypothetical protein
MGGRKGGIYMAKTEIKTTKKNNDGTTATIVKTVTEQLTYAEVIQRKNQFIMQQQGILNQMKTLKNQYDALTQDIAELDELLAGFKQDMPTIE